MCRAYESFLVPKAFRKEKCGHVSWSVTSYRDYHLIIEVDITCTGMYCGTHRLPKIRFHQNLTWRWSPLDLELMRDPNGGGPWASAAPPIHLVPFVLSPHAHDTGAPAFLIFVWRCTFIFLFFKFFLFL